MPLEQGRLMLTRLLALIGHAVLRVIAMADRLEDQHERQAATRVQRQASEPHECAVCRDALSAGREVASGLCDCCRIELLEALEGLDVETGQRDLN